MLPDHEEIVSAGIRLADLEEFKDEDDNEQIDKDKIRHDCAEIPIVKSDEDHE